MKANSIIKCNAACVSSHDVAAAVRSLLPIMFDFFEEDLLPELLFHLVLLSNAENSLTFFTEFP